MLKNKSLPWLTIIVLLIATMALTNTGIASSTTRLYVDPPIVTAAPGEELDVEIKVDNIQFLYTWQFYLSWNPNLLEVLDNPETPEIDGGFTEGPFLKKAGETNQVAKMINETTLFAMCSVAGVDPQAAPSGSGTLAIITFAVKAEGECTLSLSSTKLISFSSIVEPIPIEMPHLVEDGYYKSPLPVLSVQPSIILDPTLVPGSNFIINISAVDIGKGETPQDLYAWQFFLYWDPDILNATEPTEGPFLSQNGTYPTDFLGEVNQTGGYLHANCTLVGDVPGASGNGAIATIGFAVEARGDTSLDLDKTELVDSENTTILHATQDGFFDNDLNDIAVTGLEASHTTVKSGELVTIDVTITNQGFTNQTSIDVSVTTPSPPSPAYTDIGTETILSLAPGQEKSLTFSWDTKGAAEGNYTIKAQISTIGDEIPGNNWMEYTIEVTSPEQLPITLIIAVIAAVALIGVAMVLYIRRRSPKT